MPVKQVTIHTMLSGMTHWLIVCCIAVCVMLMLPLTGSAQQRMLSDTLDIRFRKDSVIIEMGFDGNMRRWTAFQNAFNSQYGNLPSHSLRIDIYSGASPEGNAAYNNWLGEMRGQAVKRLIQRRLGSTVGIVEVHNEGARWSGLYSLVEASNEPWRDQVLDIIAHTTPADAGSKLDPRELQLRQLEGGTVWPVLQQRYLAQLRSGASAIVTFIEEPTRRDTLVVENRQVQRDTIVIIKEIHHHHHDVVAEVSRPDSAKLLRQARRDSIHASRLGIPAWSVKSNALLLGLATPNVELEIPLGRSNRWSLQAEYWLSWFTFSNNSLASQIQNLGVEMRRWLGNRRHHPWLQGWHIGLAVAAGYYDIEWKRHEGYQGEHLNAYINIGYQHRWGRHWAIDMGLGLGALYTKYRHYYGSSVYPQNHLTEQDDLLIWHNNGHLLWPGPCHANISIAYMFNAWPFHTKH